MQENRHRSIAALTLFALGLAACGILFGLSSVRAAGQSGANVRGKGLGDAKPIVIEGRADKDVHVTSGWKLFLVGTNQYVNMDKEDDLHYAVKDVKALEARFIELGVPAANITILTTGERRGLFPDKNNIESAFNRFIASLKPGDCAFVYLSGHGFRFEREKRTYYAPQDVDVTSKSSIKETSISIDDMMTALNDSAANLKWMTVDACRNDPTKYMDDDPNPAIKGVDSIGVAKDCIVDSSGLPNTFIFMQGCEDGQCSIESPELEQGLMTYSLLEALSYDDNPVDRSENFEIKLVDLLSYVQTRTEELASRCRDRSNKPCVQKPAITNYSLQNATFLKDLRRGGLTRDQWQAIKTEEERFVEYLVASDFERAQDSLTTLAGYYPEGTASEKYKQLNGKLQEAKRQQEENDELAKKRQQAEANYENAQTALDSEKYAKAKTFIDAAIQLYKDPKYTTFRNVTLTLAVTAEVKQAITDRDFEKADSLNNLLSELDANAASNYERQILALKPTPPKPETPETPPATVKQDSPTSSRSDQTSIVDSSGSKAGALKTLTIAGVKVNFHWAPAGTFQMGSPESNGNETQHKVTLSKGFWIAETETTQELWEAVMGNNPSCFTGDKQLPVEYVSWNDCQEFVEKLNSSYSSALPSGYKYAMPTEAQWEYACRAGTTTAYNFGTTWDNSKANNGSSSTKPVKSYEPNAWGLYDMHGNVLEWCADWYGRYDTSSSATSDPAGPGSGSSRVLRGGSRISYATDCRSARRFDYAPERRGEDSGFRLALVR